MNIIIYHKNCMDGLASAFITRDALDSKDILTMPLQYGEELEFFNKLDEMIDYMSEGLYIYFVDFSFKQDNMRRLLRTSDIKEVTVIDHHKTADAELSMLKDEFDNFEFIYDVEKSGATLCYEYFKSNLKKDIFNFIEDRDLWKWNLHSSRAVSAYLSTQIKPNCLDSFEMAYEYFDFIESAKYGHMILKKQSLQVESKVKKVNTITIKDVAFSYVNATENISELGNAICEKYKTCALVYFVNDKNEYVCSLRSLDNLADVSSVAKAFGGGGHRNASGFTLSANDFFNIFYRKVPTLRDIEFEIKKYFSRQGFKDGVGNWGFTTYYKNKRFTVMSYGEEEASVLYEEIDENADELFIKVFNYFKGL